MHRPCFQYPSSVGIPEMCQQPLAATFAREVAVCLRLPGYNPKHALIREAGRFRPMKQRCQRNWVAALAAMAMLAAVGGMASGCALPSLEGRGVSSAMDMEEARSTHLGEAVTPLIAAHPGRSGTRLIADPEEAFATWVQLTRAAERTLDLQYYIWFGDTAGSLMLGELREAAAQGVRVRVLLDDQGTSGLDATLATLDEHPNIEVRLFNPFVLREFKWLGFLTDFSRANRRMHDKALVADNQVALIGGRNIGDQYFSSTDGFLFFDLDVLAVGAVVPRPRRVSMPSGPAGRPIRRIGSCRTWSQGRAKNNCQVLTNRRTRRKPRSTQKSSRTTGSSRNCSRAKPNWNGRPPGWSATAPPRDWTGTSAMPKTC